MPIFARYAIPASGFEIWDTRRGSWGARARMKYLYHSNNYRNHLSPRSFGSVAGGRGFMSLHDHRNFCAQPTIAHRACIPGRVSRIPCAYELKYTIAKP